MGNNCVKTIDNPRLIRYRLSPHVPDYFEEKTFVYSNGERHHSILADKIVVNHYYVKSKEEFLLKQNKGRADGCSLELPMFLFHQNDRNDIFDDGILKYRAARAKSFSFENDENRTKRVVNALFKILTQSYDSLVGKMETFLTCRTVAEKFGVKIFEQSAEEYSLAWIYRTLLKANPLTYADIQMFLKELPKILERPFPICKEIKILTQDDIIPCFCKSLEESNVIKSPDFWKTHNDVLQLQKLLRLIK